MENNNKNEINVLDELNKGACMGKDAIYFIMDKVHDEELKEELNKEYNQYKKIIEKISSLYPEYSEKEPHKTNAMNKAMTWYGIEMRTMIDDTTSKIAELLMQGVNMGIIEGRRLMNQKDIEPEVEEILKTYIDMQEESVEKLKQFL